MEMPTALNHDLLFEVGCMTPAVIRAAAITAAKRLGAPTGAVNELIEMQGEGEQSEWHLWYAFMDDDEEWFEGKEHVLMAATLREAMNLIAGMDTAAALAARQQVEVWWAWLVAWVRQD
jgi:hypothetical protein